MTRDMQMPAGDGLPKPAFGQPCNGCGLCCLLQQCPISEALFGQADRCPALEEAGAGFGCGLIRDTGAYVPDLPSWGGAALTEAFALMLGAGAGCDGQHEDEVVSQDARDHVRELARTAIRQASPAAQALLGYFTTQGEQP